VIIKLIKDIIIFILLFYSVFIHAEPKLTVLDVGEGQAILLNEGGDGVLIDVGHLGQAGNVLRKMEKIGVSKLRFFLLTHLHPDHASGYFRIREAFPDAPVYDNCHEIKGQPDTVRWTYQALTGDRHRTCVKAGHSLSFNDVSIKILWPVEIKGNNLNQNSLVVLLEYSGKRVLIMGDVDHSVENELMKNNQLPEHVDVLVLGHHGAKDATGEKFVERVNPRIAVISVNKNNIRDYPSSEIIRRLKGKSIEVLRTDMDGDIEF